MGLQTQETQVQTNQETPEKVTPDKVYQDKMLFLVDEFIDTEYPEKTQEEIKQDRAFFPLLIDYLHNNYLKGLLHTDRTNKDYKNNKYSIKQLDGIFNIYKYLVYKYKWNNRPTIIEFGLLCGIHKETLYNWGSGITRDDITTPENLVTVKSWIDTCENALIDGNGEYVKEIFLLKSCYGYQDQNNTITVKHEMLPTLNADTLPELIDPKQLT